ncbi:hypothetical protein WEI85_09465 [Actinomycetes bacterium KLBMP 9797]
MRWTTAAVLGVAVLVFATGCGLASSTPGATPAPAGSVPGGAAPGDNSPVPNGPNVAEALDTATKEFTLLSQGDWAGAWKLWTDAAKKEVKQQDFEKVNKACPVYRGEQIQLTDVKPVGMELVELTWRHGEKVGHSALRLAGKQWQYDPGSETLAEYASGADPAITKRKADNRCPSS